MNPVATRKKDRPIPAPRRESPAADNVEQSSDASFPASDPPSWTPVERVGIPLGHADDELPVGR